MQRVIYVQKINVTAVRVAQWIEHRFPKARVAGSIPAADAFLDVTADLLSCLWLLSASVSMLIERVFVATPSWSALAAVISSM